jgi:hypothetical protein
MGWLGTWENRIKITIDQTKVDGDLTDFPALLYLSVASGISAEDLTAIFDELASDTNRKKIAVTTSDGTTQCYVEIERWDDANEVAWLWAKVPAVSGSTDTDVYLYFDSSQADNTTYVGDTGSSPGQAVWDSNFKAVYHLAEDPSGGSGCMKDSTSEANHGTPQGSMISGDLIDGIVGKAIDCDGSDDAINCGNGASLDITGDLTVEYCARFTNTALNQCLVAKDGSTGGRAFALDVYDGNQKLRFYLNGGASGNIITSDWTPSTSAFQHVAGRFIASSKYLDIFKDGVKHSPTVTGPSSAIPSSTHNVLIGAREYSGYEGNFPGKMDEVRISNSARADEWIKATYHSCWDSLATFSSTIENMIEVTIEEAAAVSAVFDVVDNYAVLDEGVGLSDEFDGTSLSPVIEEAVGLSDAESPGGSTFSTTIQDALTLSDIESAAGSTYYTGLDEDLGLSDVETPFNWTEWLSTYQQLAITRFYFTLTGAADGKTDVIIPISSVSCRLRSGDPTYLSVVIPYTSTYAGYINDRPNGDMRLDMGYEVDGEVVLQETVCTVDLETVAIDYGARNKSITLTGHRTVTYAPKVVDLANVNYYRQYDGNYTYRCATVDLYLKPGDTARYSSHSITVGRISWVISPTSQSMEVSEEN